MQLLQHTLSRYPGSWRRVLQFGQAAPAVIAHCFRCAQTIPIDGEVAGDGTVAARIDCSREECGWQDFVRLDGWG